MYACDAAEMAISQTQERDWGFEFTLRTVEGYPGWLKVRRQPPPAMYRAECSIGLYGDRIERAGKLVDAFEEQMIAFSKKRSLR